MKIRKIKYILIAFILSFSFFFVAQIQTYAKTESDSFYAELLYQVTDETEAYRLASEYQVDLIDLSSYGIATYSISESSKYIEMEADGFVPNSSYEASDLSVVLGGHTPSPIYQYALEMMNIQEAWLFTEGSPDVTIAIIDSGIDINHEEFIGRLSNISYNSRTEQVGLSYVIDTNGHGTSVAGVIGALSDNSKGIMGIVQESELLIIKANNEDDPSTLEEDESKSFSESAIIEGIYYAADHGADVINMSLGGTYANPLTRNAIEYARDLGVILVAAAGNDGTDELIYPASFDDVISVSAVDEDALIASYSNYGSKIDIAAPGTAIATSLINNTYGYASGTSLAAPQVTGIVALLISQFPNESRTQLIERILLGAVDYGDVGRDDYYGIGIINAEDSMNVVQYLVSVQFETFGGTLIDSIEVYSGHTIDVTAPEKIGHTFSGWYRDALFQMPFVMGVDLITTNSTLYAKFVPLSYTITFITEGSPCDSIEVDYGQTFLLPDTILLGYTFNGWFIDSDYTIPYTGSPVTGNLMLYASFSILLHQVTAYVNGDEYASIQVQDGNIFSLDDPHIENQRFLGWFIDADFLTPYVFGIVQDDLNLYAKFDDQQIQVLFYDSDLITIYQESYVFTGEGVIAPDAPNKPSTPSFDFIFTGWSESYDSVTYELDIYPLYEKIYKPESIVLLPGIDTISIGELWIDQETSLNDDLLDLEIRSELDVETVGTYFIYYDIYDEDTLIDTRIRVVHVIASLVHIEITLNPDITTIYVGDTYIDQGASSNIGEIETTGSVDTQNSGTYVITYRVTFENQIATKNKYVYVLLAVEDDSIVDTYYMKEEGINI
ncbi:MAG: S8 family serine peptidase [Acholeplasmataceae bacterium]|nr:S8 family serine peptidase [Acholeplasmataceae bacterium]